MNEFNTPFTYSHSTFIGGICSFFFILLVSISLPTGAQGSSERFRTIVDGGTVLEPPPNIIFISLDTLRWDRLSDLGSTGPLKRFREDSVNFKNIISPSSWTLPSHASLFTGVLPYRHRAVFRGRNRIDTSLSYIPSILKRAGYRTAGFTDGGFVSKTFGFSRGFDVYKENKRSEDRRIKNNIHSTKKWIKKEVSNKGPLFSFIHTYQIHDYGRIHPGCHEKVTSNHPSESLPLTESSSRIETLWQLPMKEKENVHLAELFYNCEIDRSYQQLEQFFRWLRQNNLYDKSMIVLFSDHGEGFSLDPKVLKHGSGQMNESLIKVPLLVKFPRQLFSNRSVSAQIPVRSIFPMLLSESFYKDTNGLRDHSPSSNELLAVINQFQDPVTYGSGYTTYRSNRDKKLKLSLFARSTHYKVISHPEHSRRLYYRVGKNELFEKRIPGWKVPDSVRRRLLETLEKHRSFSISVYRDRFRQQRKSRKEKMGERQHHPFEGLGYF
jgi:arylsulfatase A-like enzyme